jgi:hypothetical protein
MCLSSDADAGDIAVNGIMAFRHAATVSRVRNPVTNFPGAAPDWQGATTENIGNI